MDGLRPPRRHEPANLTMSNSRRAIVDAHHHLWDLDVCRYPWLMEHGVHRFFGDPTPIQRNYLVDELKRDAADYDLLGSVHIQVGVASGDEINESAWLEGVADEHRLPNAIVAFCDLVAPDALQNIERQTQFSRFRGVRQILGRSIAEDALTGSAQLIENPKWRDNLATLSDLGLSFDLQLIPPQAMQVSELLAELPDLRVAVCHAGSPSDHSESGYASWHDGMRALAGLPNVYCKISGFGMFDHTWTVDSIRPYVEGCIDLFGPERSMFGSNFPVDKLYRTYEEIWEAYASIVGGLTVEEQQMLFVETASQFYHL